VPEVTGMRKDKIMKIFVEGVRARLGAHLKNIILFGSRARGDASEDSDYDFIIILDKALPELEEAVQEFADEIFLERNALLTTFVVSEKKWDDMEYEPFIMNVKKEGIPL
jgi:predicted nucleotidyltransferase